MEELLQFVPDVHFEQIPIKNLVSNQEYQRNLSAAHVRRAAAHFDLYQINPVKVSRRNAIEDVDIEEESDVPESPQINLLEGAPKALN